MKQYVLSIKEAQTALSLGRTTIYRLLAVGELRRVKVGRRTVITVASIEQLLATSPERLVGRELL